MVSLRIVSAGDSAVTAEFDERIDSGVNAHVIAVAEAAEAAAMAGVRDIVPAYRSLTVYFDPVKTSIEAVSKELERAARKTETRPEGPLHILRIPICYGGAFGPDLGDVASFAGIDESEVIALHSTALYRVFMLGFVPGFAYLASVDSRIAVPRRGTPRVRVPAGSLGIAGVQTGIYPLDTPGGWQIVGRTSVRPFDPTRREPFLFKPGDAVQFYPIEPSDFERAEKSRMTQTAPASTID